MDIYNTLIENQYHKPGLYEDIIKRLGELNVDLNNVSRSHIAGVDEFHVRGAEVSLELAKEINLDNCRVLDVGCGIGGPARMLASEYNCKVTGIDLSHEFIRTAKGLSKLVGLQDSTEYLQSNALDLPFKNGSFDVVWTQHVQMNISNKVKFYSEICRVLAGQGRFIYYDIFRKNTEDVTYPVPWADNSSLSFLGTAHSMNNILEKLGFKRIASTDQTAKAAQFLRTLFEKLKVHGPPTLGLNVLMGITTKEKLANILKGIEEEKIVLQSGIYEKGPVN